MRAGKPDTYYNKFTSLQMALYAGPFFAAISFACYLFAAIYVDDDKKIVDDFIRSKAFFFSKSNFFQYSKFHYINHSKLKENQKSFVDLNAPSGQLSSSAEITSNENSQKDEDETVGKPTGSSHHRSKTHVNSSNEISTSHQQGKSNENFTDSKTEIADVDSQSSVANLLNKKN